VPGVTKAISETDLLSSNTKLTGVQFEVIQRIVAVEMTVESLASKPSSVSAEAAATVYKYFSLSFTNLADDNTKSAKITFKVAKDWLSTNGVSASSVALYRYAGGTWAKLVTTKTSEDTGYAYYEATTPGFSYFAIGSSQAASATTTTTAPSGQPATTTTTAPSGTTTTVPGAGTQLTDYSIIIAVIVLVLIVAVVLVAAKLGYVDLDGLFDWLRGLFGRLGWQRRKSWRDVYSEHR
jgi:PGF-pre-PGF domain-containing protein